MKIEKIIPSEKYQADEPSQALLAEMIRAEISAAKSLRRTVLVRRVCTRLQLDKPYREVVNSIIEKLVLQREILAIEQGFIVVTPIRGIKLSPTRTLLLSALPTLRLEVLLNYSVQGVEQRSIECDVNVLEILIAEAGGRCLTVGDYSAINKTTIADQQWLDELKRRQMDVMSKKYSVETVESYRWYQQKWLSFSDAGSKPNLWRGEDSSGYAVFVWSDKIDLMDGECLRLTGSDATRTRYALDRVAAHSHHIVYKKIEEGYKLAVDGYLPVNEFKALNCFSYATEVIDKVHYYSIYADCIEILRSILNTQLGIELIEENE